MYMQTLIAEYTMKHVKGPIVTEVSKISMNVSLKKPTHFESMYLNVKEARKMGRESLTLVSLK